MITITISPKNSLLKIRWHSVTDQNFCLWIGKPRCQRITAFTIFAIFFPLLIYKSIRFMAHNSVFRNIRFRFLGDRDQALADVDHDLYQNLKFTLHGTARAPIAPTMRKPVRFLADECYSDQ